MRILTLIHEYPPVGGGGGRVAQDLAEGLAARGHALMVVTAHWGDLPLTTTQNGVVIHRLRSGRKVPYKAGLLAMLGFVWAAFWRGLSLIREWKPDVLHVHFAVPAGAAAYALSRLTGVPYIMTAHLGDVPGGVPEKTGRWFKAIYPMTPPIWKHASAIAAVSTFTRDLALAHYPVTVNVIPNGVDTHALDPGIIRVNHPPRIVFAGRFVDQKNVLTIVNTLAKLSDLPWTCEMIGDGPLRPAVEQAIYTAGLTDRFVLPGWVTPEEVAAAFRRSDILFMPSLSEGLPVVGVQALSLGLALVVSQIGGWRDLILEGQNGTMRPYDDVDGFADALREYLTAPDRLLRARLASRHHAHNFDLTKILDSYEDMFQKVMESKHQA
jgi:glycosyltransferase involved in cell wall biosynthesis